jgi:hypothetical protein
MTNESVRYRLGVRQGIDAGGGQSARAAVFCCSLGAGPALVLFARDKKIGPAILAGFYMGLTFALPQMIYLCMPVPVTAILLVNLLSF